MTATIKAACPICGDVELGPAEVRLYVFPRDLARNYYAFACPSCGDYVQKPAPSAIVEALARVGVKCVRPPTEIGDVKRSGTAPAVDEDELLAFGLALSRMPAALEPERAPVTRSGPPPALTADDLLDLMLELAELPTAGEPARSGVTA